MGALLAGGLPGLLNQSSAQVVDGSLKFDKSLGTYQKRTHIAGNRKTYTWSGWIKRSSNLSTNEFFFGGGPDGNNNTEQITFFFMPTGAFRITTGSIVFRETTRLFRDPSSFYHLVVAFDTTQSTASDRIKIYVNGSLVTSYTSQGDPGQDANTGINAAVEHVLGTGAGSTYSSANTYGFDGSMSQCYFIDGLSLGPGYFGFTDPLTNTWRPKKLREGDQAVKNKQLLYNVNTSDSGFDSSSTSRTYDAASRTFATYTTPQSANVGGNGANSAHVYKSPTGSAIAWVVSTDTTDRYIWTSEDGINWTSKGSYYDTDSSPQSVTSTYIALAAGSNESNVTVTSAVVNFGTNGFYLPMDNDDFNIDKSGKGNNWTKQNFSGTFNDPDVLKDSPSGAVSGGRAQTGITTTSSAPSNYCTLNPLDTTLGGNLQDGNLKAVGSSNWSVSHARGTFALTYGKWYWEGTKSGGGSTGQFGFANSSANLNESYGSAPANSWTFYFGNGTEIIVPAANSGGYFSGSAMTNGDTAGVALDMDNGTWQFFKNGVGGDIKTLVDTDSGSTVSITELYPYVGSYDSIIDLNFGQKPFKYAPPQGFLPLNSASATPETVITRPDQFVDVSTWTGNGGPQIINAGLKPDLVWIKNRDTSGYSNALMDSVRGPTKQLRSNTTASEVTSSTTLTSFDSNGFTVNNNNISNQTGKTYVAWSWKAGGNKNTFNVDDVGYASAAAAGLTGGTITPTGSSVGTRQGFSIIGFTDGGSACSIPHGLTKAPDFYIVKFRGATGNWSIYHKSLGNTKRLKFTTDDSGSADAGWWQNTSPTSSLFYLGGNLITSTTQIAYLWCDVPGLQKFGTFIGNASADGNFIELGFRPALVWIKPLYSYNGGASIIAQTGWYIYDNKRGTFNPNGKVLAANANYDEEDNSTDVDFLSNGFKLRNTRAVNTSSGAIYCAWAESPVSNLYGGQSNAR